ncbi:WD40 repeat-like protein [Saccharata proteae CBS 121410]|uniref:WD40 repeat-like protein n=1 Tax=Saccharata proteae CBS 121410 TaxID=1314787 RepID=A0A9P4HNX5_9PEZI|nr:WD40 repeat-like protein [Saccharata proteae CBS 121410]
MDIHRSRFIPYPPSAINALAFSYSDSNDFTGKGIRNVRLALGRANGNIELWNPDKGEWVHEITLSGGKDRSVEGLAWIQEPDEENEDGWIADGRLRLFSIGYSSTVTEWDLVTGLPLRHSSGNHSEVWCMAAQPRWKPSGQKAKQPEREGEYRGQNIVAGCADGTLALLSTADDDLRFQRFLSRPTAKKARVLSVTWQNRDTVVAGFADSTIRVFDARNGSLIRNISLGAAGSGGPREILVWTVKCLPNGDIVSGDSTGDVRFYDGKNYSHLQRISGHEADVLDLAISRDGKVVYSGGMDRRTSVYSLSGEYGERQKWAKLTHRRYHDHDVKTMATWESKQMSVMVSGGLDTHPIVLPLRQFGIEYSRALPALPQSPPVTSAAQSRLLVSWWDREVRIWRVQGQHPKLAAHVLLQGEENITSASISQDGSVLAVASPAEIKMFQLSPRESEDAGRLRVRKLETPPLAQKGGARLLQFSPNGKWLAIINHNNQVYLVRIVRPEDESEKMRLVPKCIPLQRIERELGVQNSLNGSWGQYDRIINRVAFSDDILAVSDIAGYLDSWVVEGHEDFTAPEVEVGDEASQHETSSDDDDEENRPIIVFGQHWIRNPSGHLLPKLESSPLVLSLRPSEQSTPEPNGNPAVHPTRNNPHPHSHELPRGENRLLVVTARHQVYEFELLSGRLSDWSRRNPTSDFPPEFRGVRDRAMGCIWDVKDGRQRLWLYGSNWLFMFDMSRNLLDHAVAADGTVDAVELAKKRKRGPEDDPLRKHTSGAGSRVHERQLIGVGKKLRKITGADVASYIQLDQRPSNQQDENGEAEDVDDDHNAGALMTLRRGQSDAETGGNAEDAEDGQEGPAKRKFWHTYKYRPILGMVPISCPSAASTGKGGAHKARQSSLEVVLVERPSWDLDLPPRFVGSHER